MSLFWAMFFMVFIGLYGGLFWNNIQQKQWAWAVWQFAWMWVMAFMVIMNLQEYIRAC
jgi:hypothetical protein